ncbi:MULTISPECIES: DM13 domain-containing protein [unclassified Pedobacter]|uniref:DM13 domain-containing protein n=1 Tax=unclassified Pedobacter TaxID=2628915 RepID=UPI001E5DA6C1|nr:MULTISPECIES: DM13 domain-containing protein [unclassified Pedobacter]
MKNSIFLLIILLLFCGCKKENTPTEVLDEKVSAAAFVKAGGNFTNGPYGMVTGLAKVYMEAEVLKLAFEDFSSTNGPDLKVYLSKDINPVDFIYLGDLKSVSGNQLYTIPAGTIAKDYKYALVYCQRYKHLFGSAELKF